MVARLGPPPAQFRWVALGSQARGELHCGSDQDSGLVWADDASAESEYARTLAAAIIDALADWGLARCTGGFTADRWSFGIDRWCALVHEWVSEPVPQAVVDAEVFLDFRPLTGTLDVAAVTDALRAGSHSPRLQHGLAIAAASFPVHHAALGHVRGHRLDAKREALAPLVLIARLYALQAGSTAVGTRARLRDVAAAGVLTEGLVDDLLDAQDLLTDLRLRQQLVQIDTGRPPDHMIDLDPLDRPTRRRLAHGLRAIRSAQSTTEMLFRTEL